MTLGASRMPAEFDGQHFGDTVPAFCPQWFWVTFDNGNPTDYTLDLSRDDSYDPRLWYYDFLVLHSLDIPALRAAFGECVALGGFEPELDDSADFIAVEMLAWTS